MVYPDLTVLLSFLAPGENAEEASRLLRRVENVPLTLSIVHRLQVENVMLRYLHGSDPEMAGIAKNALLLWTRYIEEGVFEIHSFPLEDAFAQSAAWNAESTFQPPRWHLLIHVAVAATERAAFMSLDPPLRRVASKAGLALLPTKL